MRPKPGCGLAILRQLGNNAAVDQNLLRSYFATIYELPTDEGPIRTSIDGEFVDDPTTLPELLRQPFAILTAYNP